MSLTPTVMPSSANATWNFLPEEIKVQILGHLLGHNHRVEAYWKGPNETCHWEMWHRFVYSTTLSLVPLLVNREFLRLGEVVLEQQIRLTLDLCVGPKSPMPSDIFSKKSQFQLLSPILPGIRDLVLPTFASLDLSTFRKNLPSLERIKIVDTSPVYIRGCHFGYVLQGFCNELDKIDAAKLTEIVEHNYHLLKVKVESWLYSPLQNEGNLCGSIDRFSRSDLNNINLYFTAAVGLDHSNDQWHTKSFPTQRLLFDMCISKNGADVLRLYWVKDWEPLIWNLEMPLVPILEGIQNVEKTENASDTYFHPEQDSPLRVLTALQRCEPWSFAAIGDTREK